MNPPMKPEEIKELLRARGLRPTRQREVMYDALVGTTSHPTAEELFGTVRVVDPGISLATVYNTLEAFTDKGLCRRMGCARGTGACRYDADMHDHVHVVAEDGRVMDVPGDLGSRLISAIPGEVLRELERRLGVRLGRMGLQILAES